MRKERTQLEWLEKVLLPVLVNVITAILLLLGALALKEPLLDFFGGSREEYPVYCVPEPVPNKLNNELMDVELFIINRTVEPLNIQKLTELLKDKASNQGVPAESADIVLRAKKAVEIQNVIEDAEFNQDKGKIEVLPPVSEGGEWRVKVIEMRASAILKVRILTTRQLEHAKRGGMARVGIIIEYPGLNPL